MSVDAALAALNAGKPDECLATLRALGGAAADDPLALQVWALAAGRTGRSTDALALMERAVRIAPADAQAHANLAISLQAIDQMSRAMSHYAQALRLAPTHLGALNNLSDLLRRRGRPAEGWALMQRYLAAGGQAKGLEIRFAKLAMDLRRFDDAAHWFVQAESHAPGDASVEWEHAMLRLTLEDFRGGWPRYERRLDSFGLDRLGIFPYDIPRWAGEPVAGRRLLLHREQGLGDTLMFARCLAGLIEEGAELNLAVHPPLARLLAFNFPKAKTWASFTLAGAGRQPEQRWLAAAGPLDLQAPICSLGALRLADGVAPTGGYLAADPRDVARWSERLAALAGPGKPARRVGLALGTRLVRWSDDGATNAGRKTLSSQAAAGLADAAGVQWVGLHDRETAALLVDVPGLSVIDPSPWITDLADTAAIIANLDLVVSADTAVAHLAAAMGKPVLLMAWWNADWRWGVERADSYWYPDVRVVRQPSPGDWESVVSAIVGTLG
jgi:tetratricopeptide (TPR) repeat protein